MEQKTISRLTIKLVGKDYPKIVDVNRDGVFDRNREEYI